MTVAMPSHRSQKRKARCTTVGVPKNALKCREALLSEEEILVMKERQSPQSLDQSLNRLGGCVGLTLNANIVEIPTETKFERGGQGAHKLSISIEHFYEYEELVKQRCYCVLSAVGVSCSNFYCSIA